MQLNIWNFSVDERSFVLIGQRRAVNPTDRSSETVPVISNKQTLGRHFHGFPLSRRKPALDDSFYRCQMFHGGALKYPSRVLKLSKGQVACLK